MGRRKLPFPGALPHSFTQGPLVVQCIPVKCVCLLVCLSIFPFLPPSSIKASYVVYVHVIHLEGRDMDGRLDTWSNRPSLSSCYISPLVIWDGFIEATGFLSGL